MSDQSDTTESNDEPIEDRPPRRASDSIGRRQKYGPVGKKGSKWRIIK